MTYLTYRCFHCNASNFGILVEKDGNFIKFICKNCFCGFTLETTPKFKSEWRKGYKENIVAWEEEEADGYFG